MAANKQPYDKRIQDRLDAAVAKLGKQGRLGDVKSVCPPDLRKKIHDAERRNASK